ncbi:hypothetical protein HKX48_007036 [Thoreauomyces humboldtii]|nr:hypothetical protein HKX48_007036 [Thoreauomyces humboldtii]
MASAGIPGLRLIPDFVSEQEADELIAELDSRPWGGRGNPPNAELRRRTQQFGHVFSFVTRTLDEALGPLPDFLNSVVERMQREEIFHGPPDLCLINEYDVGQGIMPHVDARTFGPTVTSLSLLSQCIMTFQHVETGSEVAILLPTRSLLVLEGDSRYLWKHGIGKGEVDVYKEEEIQRGRRVSLTFRTRQTLQA